MSAYCYLRKLQKTSVMTRMIVVTSFEFKNIKMKTAKDNDKPVPEAKNYKFNGVSGLKVHSTSVLQGLVMLAST